MMRKSGTLVTEGIGRIKEQNLHHKFKYSERFDI